MTIDPFVRFLICSGLGVNAHYHIYSLMEVGSLDAYLLIDVRRHERRHWQVSLPIEGSTFLLESLKAHSVVCEPWRELVDDHYRNIF